MDISKAKSDKDKAREDGIDIQKTRRRVEDAIRKGKPGAILEVAKLLGVEVAEERPSELEIFLANIWQTLDEIPYAHTPKQLGGLQNKILDTLPERFKTFFWASGTSSVWNRTSRDFLTKGSAQLYKRGNLLMVNNLNVVLMRMAINDLSKDITKKTQRSNDWLPYPSLTPDEDEEIKKLKRILY